MSNYKSPPAPAKQRPRPTQRFLAVATLPFLAALLLLVAACRSAEGEVATLSGDEVRAGGEVEFVAESTPAAEAIVPLAAVATSSGYVPAAFGSPLDPTPTPTPTATPPSALGPPLPAPTVVVAIPPVDFAAAREDAASRGLGLAFTKIGFHVAVGGNTRGISDYFRKLNDAGVPIFLKSVDADGQIFEVQEMMKANEAAGRNVPHILVFRQTDARYEAPFYNYALSPEEAAAISWQLNRDSWSSRLDKKYVWFETLNEPGRLGHNGALQIERIARFSLATAKLAVAEGYRYAALSFSPGVPEPEDWEHPAMLEFLRYAAQHPDQVGVALHEGSFTIDCIAPPCTPDPTDEEQPIYPYMVGRFQLLFDACDRHGIGRPTLFLTEWGWEYGNVPDPAPAMEDLAWASWLLAAYPTVKGAAIWYLGPQFNGIAHRAQPLIAPLGEFAVSHYFLYHPGIGQIDPGIFRPTPPAQPGLNDTADSAATPFPSPRFMP